MRRIKKIFESTVARAISATLVIALVLSGFFCFDFYKDQVYRMKSYYWIYKGDKAFRKHELQDAINCYEYGIKLNPKHYKAMYNLANIYVVYEDYYSALRNYEKALNVKPDFDVARIDYAIILAQTYSVDRAITEYKKVIETQSNPIKIPFLNNDKAYIYNKGVAYYNLGIAYRTKSLLAGLNEYSRKRYMNKASDSYKSATEILNSYDAFYNLALIHQLLHDKTQAGYYYCKAMELSPMEYEAHFNYAVLLNEMEIYDGAAEEFKKAGLILGSKGEGVKTAYIYNVLNDVHQKMATMSNSEYLNKIKEKEQEEASRSKYKAGKLLIDDSSDEELKGFFGKCAYKEKFMGDE